MTSARLFVLAALLFACSDVTTELVPRRDGLAPADAAPPDADGQARDASAPMGCGPGGCACNNGRDDDGDGLIDGLDPECTGPFDNDEQSFATGRPGTGLDFCLDCFWDNDNGAADDGCEIHVQCLFGETPSGASSAGCTECAPSQRCVENCLKRTPNGCDCFGCCEVRSAGGPVTVLLSDTCSVADAQDETKCPRCVQSTACRNPCGDCELCLGMNRKDLPPMCRGRGRPATEDPVNVCDEGQLVCAIDEPCPPDFYCQLGCCF